MNPGEEARRKLVDAPADLRLATLFAPAAQRHALTALFAVYMEIREIQRECSDRGVASAKLGWWEEEIDALCAGHPRHPLTRQLTPFVPRLAAQHDCFHAIIAGVQMDVSAAGCASFEDVKRQCYRHAGALAELTAALNGAASTEAFHAARLLGNAWRLAEIVTGGIAQALHGHMYFAADDLHRHGVDLHITGDAHSNAGVSALLADYARRAEAMQTQAALRLLPPAERQSLAAWQILNGLARKRLKKLAARSFVADAEPLELPPLSALLAAWAAARQAARFSHS